MALSLDESGLACDAAHMLGIARQGDEAIEWNLRTLHLSENAADEGARKWAAPVRNNLGWTYHDLGRYEEALHCFEWALIHRVRAGDERSIHIASWCVARCLRSLGRIEEALELQLVLLSRLGKEDGYVSEEIGECFLAQGRTEAAAPHFRKAHELLSNEPGVSPERLERLKSLSG